MAGCLVASALKCLEGEGLKPGVHFVVARELKRANLQGGEWFSRRACQNTVTP